MRDEHGDCAVHNWPPACPQIGGGNHREGIPGMTRGRNSDGRLLVYVLVVAFALLMITGCGGEGASEYETTESNGTEQPSEAGPALSDTARAGQELFDSNCSVCHGVGAAGTNQGPPLIGRIYHPGHHPDFSIRNAVSQGVQQHHWVFGDMPPVAGVSSDDVEKIICYVREMQRADGIFEGDAFSTVC